MSQLSGRTIGFIGLGHMGRPMARNLKAAGAELRLYNRSRAVVDELAAEGMTAAATPAEVARQADTVIVMVADTPAVEQVLLGPSGVLEGLAPDTLVIDMGTTLMTKTQDFAKAVRAEGGAYVDAPVSGGTLGAEQGNLTIMAGGEESDFARALPVLEVLGGRITHVGGVGAGQVAKAANQVIVGLNIGAVAEALVLAKKAGVDPAKVRAALGGGFADSRILELHGQRMVDGAFKPGARMPIQRKDMDQALVLAEHFGFEMPATALSRELYDKAISAGNDDLDHSGLITAIDPDWPVSER